jgi:hypothetical protein
MSSLSFQERFKSRTTILSNSGALLINPSASITKAKASQLHSLPKAQMSSPVSKSSKVSPQYPLGHSGSSFYSSELKALSEVPSLKHSYKPDKPLDKSPSRHQYQSSLPVRKKNYSSMDCNEIVNKTYIKIDYTPYTLKDYKTIKPQTYYLLGGLGPSNIGTEDWSKKKELKEKRWSYGKDVYYSNAAKLPILGNNSPSRTKLLKDSTRFKALEFAKSIIRPPLKVNIWPSQF